MPDENYLTSSELLENFDEILNSNPQPFIKKKRVCHYHYNPLWESNENYMDWISSVENNSRRAFCNACNSSVLASEKSILNHFNSYKHYRNYTLSKGNPDKEFLPKSPNFNVEVARMELMIVAFLVSKHLSFLLCDTMVPFIKLLVPADPLLQKIRMTRRKATALCINVIARVEKMRLIKICISQVFAIWLTK